MKSELEIKKPGPGDYLAENSLDVLLKGPSAKIGTEKRMSLNNPEQRGTRMPGPGEHNVDAYSNIKSRAPIYGFGSSKRPKASNLDGKADTHYNLP